MVLYYNFPGVVLLWLCVVVVVRVVDALSYEKHGKLEIMGLIFMAWLADLILHIFSFSWSHKRKILVLIIFCFIVM